LAERGGAEDIPVIGLFPEFCKKGICFFPICFGSVKRKPNLNQDAVVEFSHVSQEIENSRVLSDVSFRIGAGERWAIVGPNGSGKTTLLKIINGYLRPSKGRVEILGGAFGETSLPELRKRSGFVSSYLDNLLVSDDNVLDVVVSGRYGATRLWEIPPIGEVNKGKKILRELGCLRFGSRKLGELSQGERQKVLIGRSLMANPALLTFDEPCAPLDLGSREAFLKGIDVIAKDRRTLAMIYITHRIDEIPACFTRALLLKKGRVVAQGAIGKVITSKNLSRSFGLEVEVRRWRGRLYPVVAS
jgi:iron complex transport system ATP-binding protein